MNFWYKNEIEGDVPCSQINFDLSESAKLPFTVTAAAHAASECRLGIVGQNKLAGVIRGRPGSDQSSVSDCSICLCSLFEHSLEATEAEVNCV